MGDDKKDISDALGEFTIPSMDEIEEERVRLTKGKEKRMITVMVVILIILIAIAMILVSLLMGVFSLNDLEHMLGAKFLHQNCLLSFSSYFTSQYMQR